MDCTGGYDEMESLCRDHCINKYKCAGEQNICVHVGNVCNRYPDCPFSDDETFCHIQRVICPSNCHCLLHAIQCQNNHENEIIFKYPKTYIFIYFINICKPPKTDIKFYNAISVQLTQSFVTDLCNVHHFPNCLSLTLRQNSIKRISKKCSDLMPLLRSLDLSDNKIAVIAKLAFSRLSKLHFLNISNNPLTVLPILFAKKAQIFLHMVNMHPQIIDIMAFANVKIKSIITKDHHVCCIIPDNTLCPANKPWYISCSDILPNRMIKNFYAIISVLIILLNSASALSHILRYKKNSTFHITIVCININDTLSGIYLFTIWIADFSLKGTFSVKEHLWRSSLVCFGAFTVILLFTVLTQLLLLFLSLSRLMIIIYPVDTNFKQLKYVSRTLVSAFLFSLFIAVVISSLYKFEEKYIPISLCLPFIDPSAKILLIKIVTWFTVITQLISSVTIFTIHIVLVAKLKMSDELFRKSKSISSDSILISQLAIITLSNIICWFPSNSIYIIAMFSSTYPINLIIWTTVIGLPINSLINPLTFLCVFFRQYMQNVNKCSSKLPI